LTSPLQRRPRAGPPRWSTPTVADRIPPVLGHRRDLATPWRATASSTVSPSSADSIAAAVTSSNPQRTVGGRSGRGGVSGRINSRANASPFPGQQHRRITVPPQTVSGGLGGGNAICLAFRGGPPPTTNPNGGGPAVPETAPQKRRSASGRRTYGSFRVFVYPGLGHPRMPASDTCRQTGQRPHRGTSRSKRTDLPPAICASWLYPGSPADRRTLPAAAATNPNTPANPARRHRQHPPTVMPARRPAFIENATIAVAAGHHQDHHAGRPLENPHPPQPPHRTRRQHHLHDAIAHPCLRNRPTPPSRLTTANPSPGTRPHPTSLCHVRRLCLGCHAGPGLFLVQNLG